MLRAHLTALRQRLDPGHPDDVGTLDFLDLLEREIETHTVPRPAPLFAVGDAG